MTRFRILVLLLAVAGMASGALLGIGHWYGLGVSMVPLAVLAYLAARSDSYTPDAPIYQAGAAELVRRWARRVTLSGVVLILIALLATVLTMGIIIPVQDLAKIPDWVLAAINMYIPYTGFALLCAGFAAWSGAVFWKKKQDAAAGANSSAV
jgi:hypothetical protein